MKTDWPSVRRGPVLDLAVFEPSAADLVHLFPPHAVSENISHNWNGSWNLLSYKSVKRGRES
jgi:hypothetical protein